MKHAFWIFLAILFSGCAAHTDLNKKSGASMFGGFKDERLAEGLFFIEAVSGMSPWKNSGGAHDTFERRATELAGDSRFDVLFIYEETGSPTGLRGHQTTTVVGYVLDRDSPLSIEEAKRVVNKKREEKWLYEITDWLK